MDELYHDFMNLFTMIMDLYFLRRFLDKDYISNGVIYTGIAHTGNYFYFLIKYFGFKITHSSYLKEDPRKAEAIVKKSTDPREIDYLIYPPELQQCSDMSSFPKNFQ